MNPPTLTDAFAVPERDPREEQPRGAVIELLERHNGRKRSYTGYESIIVPNFLRINGVAVWASYDAPATLCEVILDGKSTRPFAVTVQVMARALNIGGQPTFDPAAEQRSADVNSAAVIEIPDVDGQLDACTDLAVPYVLLNGHRLYIQDEIRVSPLATGGADRNVALVTLTLLCRQLIVDDEPGQPAGEPDDE